MPTRRIGKGVFLYPLRTRELPHLGHFKDIILPDLDQLCSKRRHTRSEETFCTKRFEPAESAVL